MLGLPKLLVFPLLRALIAAACVVGLAATAQAAFEQQLDLYTRLANEGVAEAQFYLGFMNAQGLGLAQDYRAAAKWYEAAALQGHPQAQNYLGLLYFEGNGVPRAFREAFLYFELAAVAGNQDAANNRLIVARKMTSAQITEAQKAAGEIIRALRSNVKEVILPRRTASGIAVAGGNFFLTHASAVEDCRDLTVRFETGEPREAELAQIDAFNGLALLTASGAFAEPVPLRETPVERGERVTIVGFGLDDKKRPVIETTEAMVTADPALHRVDQRYLQVSSVLGATHLGAAVVDSAGRLVGIMEPTLEVAQVAQVRGTPGRTGFAVRHELARLLLEINGHRFETGAANADPVSPTGYAALALVRAATVAIECWGGRESAASPEAGQTEAPMTPAEPG